MTFALNTAAATPPGRRRAVAVALAAAIGLGAPAAWLAGRTASGPEPKLLARLDAGPVVKRELAFTPRDRAADDSIRNFKPGKAWTMEPPTFEPAIAALIEDRPATPVKARVAAAPPRPPVRPASLARTAPAEPAPRYASLPADRRTASSGGFHLPGFVPTGAAVMKQIGGLGATMRDSIGSVGTSLGKLMRISSR
ncbi:MAG TPA: hypothetical protein P5256_13765 [Beijerinckiaceae bacterium]|nr:hypothetical protein [Beijerinckiaceae bacterium]